MSAAHAGSFSSRLRDAGRERPVAARWVVMAELTLRTDTHLGGEQDSISDMPVLWDPVDDCPLLSGSSLAGALRSHLSDYIKGYFESEPEEACELFGSAGDADGHGGESPLIVFDSYGKLPEESSVSIRDGVALDRNTELAEDKAKYDFEVIPRGTVFTVRIDLIASSQADELALMELLQIALGGLSDWSLRLGARRTRGLGAIDVGNWRCRRFDLSSRQGWIDWALSGHCDPIGARTGFATPHDALTFAASPHAGFSLQAIAKPDKRQRLVISMPLTLEGQILMRSPASSADAPDVLHLTSAGQPVVAGTGLAGALRQRAHKIASCVRRTLGDTERWVDRIFGPAKGAKQLVRSRLRVDESVIDESAPVQTTRVQIDRFTQGTAKGALFEEQPYAGGRTALELELRAPKCGEAGLLLLLVKDLITGDLPIGGAVSVGRGAFRGTAYATIPPRAALSATGTPLNSAAASTQEATQPHLLEHADGAEHCAAMSAAAAAWCDEEILSFWNAKQVTGGEQA